MKKLTIDFKGTALVIKNQSTNETIAAVLTKNGIEFHKDLDGKLKKATVIDKLLNAIKAFVNNFENKKYSYSKRLANLFAKLKELVGVNSFTKLYNQIKVA